MDIRKYFNELRRRNVFKAAVAYTVFAWLILQVGSVVFPILDVPDYYQKLLLLVLALGFPLWLIIAWIYEFTPEGIQKTDDVEPSESLTSKTSVLLNRTIVSVLLMVVLILAYQLFGQRDFSDTTLEKSIAVLAFADMSPDQDQEYFSDGISEELLNLLAKNPELRVVSRTSSFKYKSNEATVEEIGKALNASYILEGSVRKSGSTFRVTAQLINAHNGKHIWSETFDQDDQDILRIQDDIARIVSEKLHVTLFGTDKNNRVVDAEAYILYLKALYLVNQNTKESLTEAEAIINSAKLIDSFYAPIHGLHASIVQIATYNFGLKNRAEGIQEGIKSAKKAIALDSTYAVAFVELGSLQSMDWNFRESKLNLDKAVNLDPGNSNIVGTVALRQLGDVDEAISLIRKAIQLDPVNYVNHFNLATHYYYQGKLEEAESALNIFAQNRPNSSLRYYLTTRLKIAQGKLEEAIDAAEKERNPFFHLYAKCFAYHAAGQVEKANQFLEELELTYGKTEAANMADIYAFRGEIDEAFNWLFKAVEMRDPVILEILTYPSFNELYKDPRWDEIINKMNLPANHGYPAG